MLGACAARVKFSSDKYSFRYQNWLGITHMLGDHTALVTTGIALPSTGYALDLEKAAALAREEKAKSTRRVYGTDFRIFTGTGARPAA